MLSALHAIVSSSNCADYVAFAACSTLAAICTGLEDAPSRPMGSAYTAFMPHLASRLGHAVSVRYGKLASVILACLGNLTAASPPELVQTDASSLISSITGLLSHKEVVQDRELLRATHTALTKLAAVVPTVFVSAFEQLLPGLLTAAKIDVEFHLDKVEVREENEDTGANPHCA